MTVGLYEAARRAGRKIDVVLAIDFDPEVVSHINRIFPRRTPGPAK
jgi:hypothetical protein